jgi:hypothetical protein
MSTTMEPDGWSMARPAPIAAAIGSSISQHSLAPAASAASWIALRSTGVAPDGTQITIRGRPLIQLVDCFCTSRMKCLIISSATSKSAITPSRIGRMASIWPGRAAQHQFGMVADRMDNLAPAIGGIGNHRRLVEQHAAPLDIDQRVGGPKVDSHIA